MEEMTLEIFNHPLVSVSLLGVILGGVGYLLKEVRQTVASIKPGENSRELYHQPL